VDRQGEWIEVDVAIVGGALTGLALANALAAAGCTAAIVDRGRVAAAPGATRDGRVTAIARASKRFLAGCGVWRHVHDSGPIRDIIVGEGAMPLTVHYDHREVGDEPLGWIVENELLKAALLARVAEQEGIRILDGAAIERIEPQRAAVELRLGDGRRVRAALLAACDGRGSSVRERLGIGRREWRYDQIGMVCTLAHQRPHQGVAIERFFPDGPFAVLPMAEPRRSSIVWALREDLARQVMRLDDAAFAAEVAERFADRLGAVEVVGPRFSYPLVLVWADGYTAPRAALVGDAAHGIHPIAGQGWNLAVRDVATLAEIVADQVRLGLDPGDPLALERYAAWRSFDSLALVAITDGINRLFANDILPVKLARNIGLGLVERLPPAKRFFMHHAMGLVGDLPRAMRPGETRR
jgi:2-octaprenyl-6-methoxyphenol hydroxylase